LSPRIVTTPSAQRDRRLHALGVTPWVLRGSRPAGTVDAPRAVDAPVESTASDIARVPCTLLLPATCTPRELDRVGRVLHAFGADFARAPRVKVPAEGLREAPPPARAYLAFGEAQARALGQMLSAAAMREAEVVLLDAPDALGQGAAKQRLWLAMKALRRRLQES
jgi:hypothetical protein